MPLFQKGSKSRAAAWVAGGLLAAGLFGRYGRAESVDSGELAAANRYAADLRYKAEMANIQAFEKAQAQARADMAPWRKAGLEALGQLANGLRDGRFDVPEFEAPAVDDEGDIDDPGYRFRRREGERALNRRLHARGVRGGARIKALLRYNSDIASQEYSAAHARAVTEHQLNERQKQQQYNRLAGLAGTGQIATRDIINTDRGYTIAQANARIAGADAQGQGAIGAANADIFAQLSKQNARQQNWNNLLNVGSLAVGGFVGYHKAKR